MLQENPLVSIIVPVYNGGRFLGECLAAVNNASYRPIEVIVVDDASTDDSAAIARGQGATVLHLSRQSGPAAARNRGAGAARGEILFFVDADVVIQRGSITRVVEDFRKHRDAAAVFGSYDDSPAEANFVSQYKNLYHHFTHQQASESAMTFWAGCGAIRRQMFEASGGFDDRRYHRPSIEDIELGYRLRRMGQRIVLDKKLQGKHLKRWSFGSLLRADIFHRAVPWSQLILETGGVVNDLNLKVTERVSAGLVGASVLLLPLVPFRPILGSAVILGLLALTVGINHRLYAFFVRRKGLGFAAAACPLHLLYYIYSSVTFLLCWCAHGLAGRPALGRVVR